MHYLVVLVWAVLNLLAYVGYGHYALRAAGIRRSQWPFAGAVGAACIVAAGGVLNLASLLTKPILSAVVVCGFLLWLLAYRGRRRRVWGGIRGFRREVTRSPWKLAVALVLLVLLCACFFGNIVTLRFMPFDDLIAYGDYALQTSQLGTLPANPFGTRRIESSLGGGYVLQAMILVAGDLRSIYIPDISLGFLLTVGAAYLIGRRWLRRGASLLLAGVVFLACFLLINASYYILPEALILTLCWLAWKEPEQSHRWLLRCVLLGGAAGALATLKSTYVSFSFIFCFVLFAAWLLTRRRGYIAAGALACAASAIAVLFPWMLDQRRKEGTWLFPVLGRGFDSSASELILRGGHGAIALRWPVWKFSLPFLLLWGVVLVLLLVWRNLRQEAEWPALAAVTIAASLGAFAVIAATGGDSVARYTGPMQVPTVIVVLAVASGWIKGRRRRTRELGWFAAAAAGVALIFVWNGPIRNGVLMQYPEFVLQRDGLSKNRIHYGEEVAETRKIQAAVPAGEPLLVLTMPSYAFDARRNRLLVDDFPGGAGPPPGPPITADSNQLRQYLLCYGIRYIAFTRWYTAPDKPADMPLYIAQLKQVKAYPSREGLYAWERLQTLMMSLRGAQIQELSQRYRLIYDDGANIVIDLQQPR
jgi:hypothetical protein